MGDIDALLIKLEQKKKQYDKYLTLGSVVDEKIKKVENEIEELKQKKYDDKIKETSSQIKKLLKTDSEIIPKFLDESIKQLEDEIIELDINNKKLEKENKGILDDINKTESDLNVLSDTFNSEQIDGKSFKKLSEDKGFMRQVESISEGKIKTVVEILEALQESKVKIPKEIMNHFTTENINLINFLDDELRKLV